MPPSTASVARPPLSHPWRARLLAVVVALLLPALAAELVLRRLSRADSTPGLFEAWPAAVALARGRPLAHGVWHGTPVQFNRQGLREREIEPRPAPGVRRILVLGDSVTFGQGVAQDRVYTRVAERLLNQRGTTPVELVNSGMPGFNTVQELVQLRELGPGLAPEVVVVGFFYNDVDPTPAPLPGIGAAPPAPERAPATRRIYRALLRHSRLLAWLAPRAGSVLRRLGLPATTELNRIGDGFDPASPGWLAAQRALLEMRELARERDFRLAVLVLPATVDYDGPVQPLRLYHDALRQFGQREGIPVLDVLDTLPERDLSRYWITPLDGHPDARAHEMFGAALATLLTSLEADATAASAPAPGR